MKSFALNCLRSMSTLLFIVMPVYAQVNVLEGMTAKDTKIPDVPIFNFAYKGERLRCYPSSLVETKSKKKMIAFVCVQRNLAERLLSENDDVSSEEDRGRKETKRFQQVIKDKQDTGVIYHVKIPAGDARYPGLAAREAKQILATNYYFGKYVRWLLPAKFYISLRPQYVDMIGGEDVKHYHNAGSRAGFFYYYGFDNGMNLTLQYEGIVDRKTKGNFINLSEQSNSNRRLSYVSLEYDGLTLLGGKYWSAYYDIAGMTDYFMAYGAQASGAYNNSSDGSASGTGRADRMIQIHFSLNRFESTLQYQFGHSGPEGLDSEFRYGIGGSLMYEGWKEEGWSAGAAFSYAKYEAITPLMQQMGIRGDDQSYIVGFSFKKEHFLMNGNFSYSRNHMNDDQGIYFTDVGMELYARYDFTNQIRTVAGVNWLYPLGDYAGQYEIKKGILSLQYTFGQRTFDDVVYVEVALPHGSSALGRRAHTSIAVGLRYLIDL